METAPLGQVPSAQRSFAHYALPDRQFVYDHDYTACPSDGPDHLHEHYEVYMLISGDVVACVQSQEHPLEPGDMFVLNRNEIHAFRFRSSVPYERIKMLFRPEHVAGFLGDGNDLLGFLERRSIGELNLVKGEAVRRVRLDALVGGLESYVQEASPEAQLLVRTQFVQILVRLNQLFRNAAGNRSTRGLFDDRIPGILEYLSLHAAEPLSLEQIALEHHMSKYYLCHLFKRCTGYSVIGYLSYRRILRAKELLARRCSVIDSCYQSGFAEYSSFYREFRKHTRMSPKRFAQLF